MSDCILELKGVRKSYGAVVQTEVIHGIDLKVAPGDFAALIGPSGSGKSTLLNILGLLDRPTAGDVLVQGKAISTLDDDALTRARNETLGFVFQFHHLLPALTAAENVMMPLAVRRGATSSNDLKRAREVLAEVGLADFATRQVNALSGGQQQRVAIARALVHTPSLVLADEPTGNLDTVSADSAFALMRRFHKERGMAFLIVTHDLRLAKECDRVIEIVDGFIKSDDSSDS